MSHNMAVILMKDWIRPLTLKLNESYDLCLTEEDLVAMIHRDDIKHMPKQKRMSKQNNNTVYKAREYPDCLEVVKLSGHTHLYLLGETLVVYIAAPPCADYEYADADHCSLMEEGNTEYSKEGHRCDSSYKNDYKGGIPNPEQSHGYTFGAHVMAIGSLLDCVIGSITVEDRAVCKTLGIYVEMAGKIQRAQEKLKDVSSDTPTLPPAKTTSHYSTKEAEAQSVTTEGQGDAAYLDGAPPIADVKHKGVSRYSTHIGHGRDEAGGSSGDYDMSICTDDETVTVHQGDVTAEGDSNSDGNPATFPSKRFKVHDSSQDIQAKRGRMQVRDGCAMDGHRAKRHLKTSRCKA